MSWNARTISGRGMYLKPKSEVVPETGEMDPDSCQAHACTVAEVEVDDETGEVRVLRLTNAYEIGRAMNPALAHQQIVGGAWMGISHALYETTEPYYPNRAHGPLDFSQYLMPGPGDIAEMDSVIIERPSSAWIWQPLLEERPNETLLPNAVSTADLSSAWHTGLVSPLPLPLPPPLSSSGEDDEEVLGADDESSDGVGESDGEAVIRL